MIHHNEREAFKRGAEAMRGLILARLEKAARNLSDVAKTCRLETDRLLLTAEANGIAEQAEIIRAMPAP